ncbi:hypothetical protein MOSE0_A03774 [Monosporozyma servazzii]
MLLKNLSTFLGPLTFYFAKVNALTISSDTYMNNGDITEDTTVNEGVFLAMDNGNAEKIEHSLTVKGSLYIGDTNSNDPKLDATFSGSNFVNDGLTVVNGKNITSGSVSVTFDGSSIVNTGKMLFSGPNSNSNSFNLNPTSSLENSGLIYMGQEGDSGYSSNVHIISNSITNDGTICLKNVRAYLGASISGSGCITIGDNSVYAIQSKSNVGTLGPQTLYMSSPSSIIYVDTAGLTDNIMVRGFGGGNYLSFGTSIVSHSYNSDTGILSFNIFLFITHKFNIGKGYDSSKFAMKQIDNHIGVKLANNALYYSGDDPNGVPSACKPCESASWIPVRSIASDTTSATITSTTSASITSTTSATTTSTAYAITSTTSIAPRSACRLTTTMAVTAANIQNMELSAYVRDILGNMGQYLSFRQANPDQPYPTQLNQIVMKAMFAGANDGWTSSLTGIDPNTVEMMLTGVPWYSTRILPVLQKNLNNKGVYVEGINSNVCAPKTSSSPLSVQFVSITSSASSLDSHAIPTSKITSTHVNSQSEPALSSNDLFTSTILFTASTSTSSSTPSKSSQTSEVNLSLVRNSISVSSATALSDVSSATTSSDISSTTVLSDISSTTVLSDISSTTVLSDISSTTMLSEGSSATTLSDISSTTMLSEGSSATTLSDISSTTMLSEGSSATTLSNSSSITVLSNISSTTTSSNTSSAATPSLHSTQTRSATNSSINSKEIANQSSKHVSMTKVTTVVTTEGHVVTLTTHIPCPFSNSKQATFKIANSQTQASPSALSTTNSAAAVILSQSTSTSVNSGSQHVSHVDTFSKSKLLSAEKASEEPTQSVYITAKQTNTQPPPSVKNSSHTNDVSSAVNDAGTRTSDLVYPGHSHSEQSREIAGDTRKATDKPVASTTVKSLPTADIQQQTSSAISNERSAITTKTNADASKMPGDNIISTTISVQSRITSRSSFTSRISLQQAVNGGSQNKWYGPLLSIFLLFTSLYI